MRLITNIKEMRQFSTDAKKTNKTIAFVPTMGFLHDGHASLLKKAREVGDISAMSIFVNPMQFGPNEDFASYPRDMEKDLMLAKANGVDVVFHPAANEMYPVGFQTFIDMENLSDRLCGFSRPGHFRGVATVVAKLFNIAQPDIAIFGEKDFQQTVIIKKIARDLNMDVDVITMPTIREAGGLAMSSRNSYLNKEERKAAICLYNAIKKARYIFHSGVRNADAILREAMSAIEAEPLAAIDYIKVCDIDTLDDLKEVADKAVLALAVKIGKTRLIDNCMLG